MQILLLVIHIRDTYKNHIYDSIYDYIIILNNDLGHIEEF